MTWLLAGVGQSWEEEARTTKGGEHCQVGRSFFIQFNKGSHPPAPLDTASGPSQMFGVGAGGSPRGSCPPPLVMGRLPGWAGSWAWFLWGPNEGGPPAGVQPFPGSLQ